MKRIEFVSALAPQLDLFQQHMMASLKWNPDNYALNLKLFDRYCSENYPQATTLTWEMAMGWCRKRDTEAESSCVTRTAVVCRLCDFLNQRKLANIPKLDVPDFTGGKKYIPHFFTSEELYNFFKACDEIVPYNNDPIKRANKIMVPTYFRLLYSTGARTRELLWLKKDDVNLKEGVISINTGKGHKQRYVCIHDSLLPFLEKYNKVMDQIYPNRVYFFPAGKDKHLERSWLKYNFRNVWYKYNASHAVPYDLRHHYAITNINNLVNGGFDTLDSLMYLSKSMGHSSINVTKYYYDISPALADTLEKQSGDNASQLFPDLGEETWC